MDDNGYKPVNGDLNIDIVDDWLTELESDIEFQVGNTGNVENGAEVSTPKSNNLIQLDNFHVKSEEQLYQDATGKSDCAFSNCQTLLPTESLCNRGSSDASSSSVYRAKTDAACHGSSLHDMAAYSHDPLTDLVGQSMQTSIFANAQRELPRSQSLPQVVPQRQNLQLAQQLLKQKDHQPHIHPSLLKSNIPSRHHRQQEHILFLPTQLQPSPQATLIEVQNQQKNGKAPNATRLQQNHQLNLLEQQQKLPPYEQRMSTTFKQSLGLQSNVSNLLLPQQLIGAQPDMLKMHPCQHTLHNFQQPGVPAPQQNVQQMLPPIQTHQLGGFEDRSHSLQESMQTGHQTSAALLSKAGFVDQASASVDSNCRNECASFADWHDRAYQELEFRREMYLPEVIKLYKRVRELCLQPSSAELATKYEKTRTFIEKTLKFLQMSMADMVHCSKDRFYHYLKLITWYLNSVRSRNPVSEQQLAQQLQPPRNQSQIPQLQQQTNIFLQYHLGNSALTSATSGSQDNKINLVHNGSLTGPEPRNAPSQLQHGSMHYTVRKPQRTHEINSVQNGSLKVMDQRNALDPMLHGGGRILQTNMLSTLQTNFSRKTSWNALDPTMSSLPSSSTIPILNLKQQPRHQVMQTHMLKQPMPHQLDEQEKKHMFKQNIYEVNVPNDDRIRGFRCGVLPQHHLSGQHLDYSPQTLLPSTPPSNASSPQTSQRSSTHIDLKNLLSPLSKFGSPLQSYVSPSTPLTPSSSAVDPEKSTSRICLLPPVQNIESPQIPIEIAPIRSLDSIQSQVPAMGTPELLASPFLAEFTGPEDCQQTKAKEPSFKRLLEVVESTSQRALNASLQDIDVAISMIDRIAETSVSRESRLAVAIDLAAETSDHLQGRTFSLHCGSTLLKGMKRLFSTTVSDLSSSPFDEENGNLDPLGSQTCDVELTATSKIKRRIIEFNDALLGEIKEINQQLMETVVDVVSDFAEDASKTGFGEGTIVRCSYIAVGLDGNFNQQYASSSLLPSLPVRVLVPADYPISSPILLSMSPRDWSEAGDGDCLSDRAKSRLTLSLRKLSQPISLGDIARTWDVCARTVTLEFAQSMGGGSFSSTYGTWENCITAA